MCIVVAVSSLNQLHKQKHGQMNLGVSSKQSLLLSVYSQQSLMSVLKQSDILMPVTANNLKQWNIC